MKVTRIQYFRIVEEKHLLNNMKREFRRNLLFEAKLTVFCVLISKLTEIRYTFDAVQPL